MLIRLTSPEAFDRLIDLLEKKRHLEWPDLKTKESYRDWFIRKTRKEMETDTVFLDVEWEYDHEKGAITARAGAMRLSEMCTDEEYLKDDNDETD